MLKKVFAMSLSVLLMATFGTSSFAAETTSTEYDKVIASIEKTNSEIELKIAKAVSDADELEAKYISDIQKLEEGDTVVKLKDQKSKLQAELEKNNDINKIEKINKELLELDSKLEKETIRINKKMASLTEDIESLQLFSPENEKDQKLVKEKLERLKNQLDKKVEKYNDRTEKFTNDLDKLITDLYNTTLKMSTDAINKAAEKGIQAEATWTLVELGGRWVWIDPIRVGC
jgi:DNA repair exonuclease SbcCD ATPase subunit